MPLEIVACPVCEQKLAVQEYVVVGVQIVCNNCGRSLRIKQRQPLRVEVVPEEATFNSDDRPESYG
ncbi:MAG: hypothetical protein GFH27_549287n336 [Chloroflexi bacterium AL-W]|nr:hypothetical protein [Chloroflexi bacterium AL-N1]NOK66610.1 hypothetical protein [Chloroflexi bacterium AL-N10]NOK71998.1 hypothetical protein [Chloroflexi bacterium AL-N5]NOK81255.1 hypothetical protein [Chloroflexi bacterium AL-W]NOK89528.1 hypothetical protein [Chloroflexi bacterium AL-N15]